MSPELERLIERARTHIMTDEERRAQRRSWVKGQFMLSHPEYTEEEVEDLLDHTLPELRRPE